MGMEVARQLGDAQDTEKSSSGECSLSLGKIHQKSSLHLEFQVKSLPPCRADCLSVGPSGRQELLADSVWNEETNETYFQSEITAGISVTSSSNSDLKHGDLEP